MSLAIEVNDQEVVEAVRKLGDLYKPLAAKHYRAAMRSAVAIQKSALRPLIPTDSGALANTAYSKIKSAGTADIYATIGLGSHIAPILNNGRAPGATPPPTDAFLSKVSSTGNPEAQAFLIARAIGIKGIAGRHFYERAAEAAQPAIEVLFAAANEALVEEMSKIGS